MTKPKLTMLKSPLRVIGNYFEEREFRAKAERKAKRKAKASTKPIPLVNVIII